MLRSARLAPLALAGFLAVASSGRCFAQGDSIGSGVDERVRRIEHGLVPASVAQDEPVPQYGLSERMGHYHVPGLCAAFIENGKVAWVRAYGFADLATRTPVTVNTLFQAASISKPVTALAVMRLVEKGKLRLDEGIDHQLRSWHIPENEFTRTEKVTVRRLLSHTAGITVHGFAGYNVGEPLPTLAQILDGEKPANSDPVRVAAIPGTAYSYSGGGYVLLRALMTDVTRVPFPELMHQLVLQPIGMTQSTFAQPLPERLQAFAASAHQSDGRPYPGRFHVYPEMAPDGLWTTAEDLARFAIEIQHALAGRSSVLSQASARAMLTEQMNGYALGVRVGTDEDRHWFEHDGSNFGFFAEMLVYTDPPGQGLIVLTNGNNINLRLEFERAVAREYGWPGFEPQKHTALRGVAPETLASYAGVYEEAGAGRLVVTLSNDKLFLDAAGMRIEAEPMIPEREDRFFIPCSRDEFIFKRDPGGKVGSLVVQPHMGSGGFEAKRVSE